MIFFSSSRLVAMAACLSISAALAPRVALAAPTAADAETTPTPSDDGHARAYAGPDRKGTGKIVSGSILTAISTQLIAGGIAITGSDSYSMAEDVPKIAGGTVIAIGTIWALAGVALLASGISDRLASTRSAWVGAPGDAGWMWHL
jgi:hypothetical protein